MLFSYFDRIYILNLPQRVDRLQATVKELESVGIDLEHEKVKIFPAIKPDTLEPFHKLGSKGCFLSVLEILKRSREESLKNVLIFQDDIKFVPGFKDYEQDLVEQLKQKKWDIVQFGYFLSHRISPQANKHAPVSLTDCSENLIGAHCFAVNGDSFDAFITFLEDLLKRPRDHPMGGPMPIDGAFNVFRQRNKNIVRLIAVPSMAGQRSSRSDVTPSWFDHVPLLSKLIESLRRLK